MKRNAITHDKTADLATRLGLERWGAVGILESLWHATAERTPKGDIGSKSDEAIAFYVGWRGDPAALIDALVESRWLERHDEYRLVIHDWADHADDAVNMSLARAGLRFWCGRMPKLTRLSKVEKERAEAIYAQEGRSVHTENARHTHAVCTADARQTHAVHTENALPCHPLPSPALPSPASPCVGAGAPDPPKRARFVPPTLDEVRAYCDERGKGVDAERWMAHYEAKGWKIGRDPIKDWRAAVRTWERNDDGRNGTSARGGAGPGGARTTPEARRAAKAEREFAGGDHGNRIRRFDASEPHDAA